LLQNHNPRPFIEERSIGLMTDRERSRSLRNMTDHPFDQAICALPYWSWASIKLHNNTSFVPSPQQV